MEKNETLLKALYRQDFYSFLRRVFAEVSSNAIFQSNWHIEVIIHYLQLAMEGKEKRLKSALWLCLRIFWVKIHESGFFV